MRRDAARHDFRGSGGARARETTRGHGTETARI
jgi:hypothetical protein